MTHVTKLERVEREPGAGDRGPWAAFGPEGQRVATVYALPMEEMRSRGLSPVATTSDRPIEGVSVVPHPAADGQQYLVVLWHVSPDEASRLR
jgi:hypothetical protein